VALTAEDLESIRQLKARYFRTIDTKQWRELRTLFTDDARFETGRGAFSDPDVFVDSLAELLADARTVHQGFMPEIVRHGPDAARGIWAMFDLVEWPGGDERSFVGYGHYEEKYRKDEDGWKIAFLRLTRLRVDLLSGGPHPQLATFARATGTSWLTG
jgi:hypothetical protein